MLGVESTVRVVSSASPTRKMNAAFSAMGRPPIFYLISYSLVTTGMTMGLRLVVLNR